MDHDDIEPGWEPTPIHRPGPALYLLIGPPCSGKSTWARRHFRPSQVVSWDGTLRSLSDGEVPAYYETHRLMAARVELRCQIGRTTVVDGLNVEPERRAPYVEMARHYGLPVYALVISADVDTLHRRLEVRMARRTHPDICDHQALDVWIKRTPSPRDLAGERYDGVWLVRP